MKRFEYQLRFLTPAFLGDAEQSARWRTPPIKHLLRQWWRVVWAADNGFPNGDPALKRMRHEEGLLFGHAWLEDDYFERDGRQLKTAGRKSLLRLRLDTGTSAETCWRTGSQAGVSPLSTTLATSYAWFGLVDAKTKKPLRNAIKADGPESQARLKLAAPDSAAASIGWAIRLIHEFGTLGSRSRGGWGSVTVDGDGLEGPFDPSKVTVPWQRCLQSDWAQGIARCDLGPWIWESQKPYSEWHQAMSLVAEERRAARQFLKQPDGDLRKALGFAGTGRMPSPLRWKLVEDRSGGLKVRIFAMPHALPRDSGESLSAEHLQRAWRDVARHLDSSANLQRAFEA